MASPTTCCAATGTAAGWRPRRGSGWGFPSPYTPSDYDEADARISAAKLGPDSCLRLTIFRRISARRSSCGSSVSLPTTRSHLVWSAPRAPPGCGSRARCARSTTDFREHDRGGHTHPPDRDPHGSDARRGGGRAAPAGAATVAARRPGRRGGGLAAVAVACRRARGGAPHVDALARRRAGRGDQRRRPARAASPARGTSTTSPTPRWAISRRSGRNPVGRGASRRARPLPSNWGVKAWVTSSMWIAADGSALRTTTVGKPVDRNAQVRPISPRAATRAHRSATRGSARRRTSRRASPAAGRSAA